MPEQPVKIHPNATVVGNPARIKGYASAEMLPAMGGEHAHRKLEQFLVCIKGRCSVLLDDGVIYEVYD